MIASVVSFLRRADTFHDVKQEVHKKDTGRTILTRGLSLFNEGTKNAQYRAARDVLEFLATRYFSLLQWFWREFVVKSTTNILWRCAQQSRLAAGIQHNNTTCKYNGYGYTPYASTQVKKNDNDFVFVEYEPRGRCYCTKSRRE